MAWFLQKFKFFLPEKKKKFKIKKEIFFALLFIYIIFPFRAGAQINWRLPEFPVGTLPELIDRVTNYLFLIILFLVVPLTMIGAALLAVSGGDTRKIEQGKKFIFYAAIGLAVAFLSKGIYYAFVYILGLS